MSSLFHLAVITTEKNCFRVVIKTCLGSLTYFALSLYIVSQWSTRPGTVSASMLCDEMTCLFIYLNIM